MGRLLALMLFWVAVLLAAVGIVTNLSGVLDLPLGVWLGAALMTLGLNVLVGGDLVAAPEAKPYSVKAKVSRAVLDIAADLPDVEVRANPDYERLATVPANAALRNSAASTQLGITLRPWQEALRAYFDDVDD